MERYGRRARSIEIFDKESGELIEKYKYGRLERGTPKDKAQLKLHNGDSHDDELH